MVLQGITYACLSGGEELVSGDMLAAHQWSERRHSAGALVWVPIGVMVLRLASKGPAMRLLRILCSPKVQCHSVRDHALRWLTLKAVTCCTVTARLSLVPATLRALWLTRSSRAISPSACALSMFSLYSTKRQYLAAESAGQPPLSALRSPAWPFSPLLRLFRCR